MNNSLYFSEHRKTHNMMRWTEVQNMTSKNKIEYLEPVPISTVISEHRKTVISEHRKAVQYDKI